VFLVEKFLTNENTDEIIEAANQGEMQASAGVLQTDELKQKKQHSEFRTSNQAWLHPRGKKTAALVETLDGRVANLTRVASSHQEHTQVLRYRPGQYYHGHMDWSELELYSGQKQIWTNAHYGWKDRMITVFWYLTDVEEGGETIFPKQGQPVCPPFQRHCPGSSEPDMASCDAPLKVKPKRGTVVLWYNFHPSGRGDRNALHAGCPPSVNDTKWSANKWVHTKPMNLAPAKWDPTHPALERYGWNKKPDPNSCKIEFRSEYADPLEVYWHWAPSKTTKKIAGLAPGQRVTQTSVVGHTFFLQGSGRKSALVTCRKGSENIYTIDRDFTMKGGSNELGREKKNSDKLGSDKAQDPAGLVGGDPNKCAVQLRNGYADPFEIYWLSNDGSPVKVAGLASGESTTLNSFVGHEFFVESKGRKSPKITCRKRSHNIYSIGSDFNIEEGSGEL
jgi:prolyl 4-hydroxylase